MFSHVSRLFRKSPVSNSAVKVLPRRPAACVPACGSKAYTSLRHNSRPSPVLQSSAIVRARASINMTRKVDKCLRSELPVGLHAYTEHCSRRKRCCFHLCKEAEQRNRSLRYHARYFYLCQLQVSSVSNMAPCAYVRRTFVVVSACHQCHEHLL